MDPQATTVLIILLLLLLVVSFSISGLQIAFFSLTNKDLNLLKTKPQPAYKRIVDLLENPSTLYASLLIAGIFADIGIIIISNLVIDNLFQFKELPLFILEFAVKAVIVATLLILFAEILPKMYARQNNIRFAKDFGMVAEGVFYLFNRIGGWMIKNSEFIERKLNKNKSRTLSDKELESTGSEEERKILKGIEKFGNISVKQIMRTRLDVSGIELETSFEELVKQIEALHYSRLPVYKNDLDEVVGILNTKDVLSYLDSPPDFDWHDLMRQPYFIHEQKMIEDLLKEFQTRRIHFAVVVDEFGGTSGIVTLEDILEEIIGDIRDEFDEEDSTYKKIDDYNYIFEGKLMITTVCKILELPQNIFDGIRGESDSLAGLVLEVAGDFPKVNQVVVSGDFEFKVLEIEKNRLQKIKVTINVK